DQIRQRDTGRVVFLGGRDDQAQVRLHEPAAGIVAGPHHPAKSAPTPRTHPARIPKLAARLGARLDQLRQSGLIVFGEQRVSADIGQVQADQVLVVPAALRPGHDDARLARLADRLDGPNVAGLIALFAGTDIELDALALLEALVARALNGREVDKHVVALLTRDEAVTLLGVEELHRSRGQLDHFLR